MSLVVHRVIEGVSLAENCNLNMLQLLMGFSCDHTLVLCVAINFSSQALAIHNSFPATQVSSRVGHREGWWCLVPGTQHPHWVSQPGAGSWCPMHVASGAQFSLLRPATITTLFLTLPLTITWPSSSGTFPQSQPRHLYGNEVGFLPTPGFILGFCILWTPGRRSQLSLLCMQSCRCWNWWQGHIQVGDAGSHCELVTAAPPAHIRSYGSNTSSCSWGDSLEVKRPSEGIMDEKHCAHYNPANHFF